MKNKYCIVFDQGALCESAEEDNTIEKLFFTFKKIDKIRKIGQLIDVIGVVLATGKVHNKGRFYQK